MTMPASALPPARHLPSAQERDVANQLRQILATQSASDPERKLRFLDSEKRPGEIILSPALSELLMDLLRHIGRGDAVTLVPVTQMLTTQQAADILNVSRPFLITLLEKGEMAHVLVGRHRRIAAEHLFAYKRRRDAQRDQALSELAELDGDNL